jgi:hypothetical protein
MHDHMGEKREEKKKTEEKNDLIFFPLTAYYSFYPRAHFTFYQQEEERMTYVLR